MIRSKCLRILTAGTAVAIVAAAAHAENQAPNSVSQAIDYRTSIMTVIRWNFKPMADMLQGKRPFDKARFAGYMGDLQSAVSMDVLAGFPEDSDEGEDTSAKAEIWMEWEDFEQKFADFRQRTSELSQAVEKGDRALIEARFAELGKACKACHKKYKE